MMDAYVCRVRRRRVSGSPQNDFMIIACHQSLPRHPLPPHQYPN